MKSVTAEDLRRLSTEAQAAPRLRKNLNLHDRLEDPIQRLCNALQPGTYIRPHRHPDNVWECFVLLRGACSIILFDQAGRINERLDLALDGTTIAEIPAGTWHCVVALAADTVVMEVKPGPYVPGTFMAWAPEEGTPQARACLSWLERAQPGERYGDG